MEKRLIAGGVESEDEASILKALSPIGPATRGVFTAGGKYTTRGWTDWTQGFQYGSLVLAFDATGDQSLLHAARKRVVTRMPAHITHTGVHDHGFNTISTFGNLRRL